MAEAANKPWINSSSVLFNKCPVVRITAGRIPQDPAVGQATILPIAPFTSEEEIAIAIAITIPLPINEFPVLQYCWRR